ncbi:tripartite tricarboxylate transporter TctB family protein [Brucellaceae bacterium C25G]
MYNNKSKQLTIPINKDIVAGGLFFSFAILFGYISSTYPMGRAAQMGPGYYPALLSGILALIGIAMGITGVRKPLEHMVIVRPSALIAVLGAPLVFAVTLRPLGFVPAVMLTSLTATLAAPKMSWKHRLLTAVFLALGCAAIFIWALSIPLPLLGNWLTR